MTPKSFVRTTLIAVLATALLSATADGQEQGPTAVGARWDVSLDLPIWPSLSDLQPVAGGSFDSAGFGIGLSYHFPVAHYANSTVLLGFDGLIGATDSDIRGIYGDFLARHLYLGPSVKWLLGEARNVSLDAGIGYHEVDMAQVDSEWWGTFEHEHWALMPADSMGLSTCYGSDIAGGSSMSQ